MSLMGGRSAATNPVRYYGKMATSNGPWELFGSPRLVHPFPQDENNASLLMVERDYAVKPDYWKKLAVGVADKTFTDAMLSQEVQIRKTPGFIYFRRTFAQMPARHVEYSSTNYTYPEYRATLFNFADILLRSEFSRTTNLRTTYDYYITTTPESTIQLLTAFQPMEGQYEINFLVAAGTMPTLTAYKEDVSAKNWIRAEDDVFEQWHGNIWRRVRKEVLAQ